MAKAAKDVTQSDAAGVSDPPGASDASRVATTKYPKLQTELPPYLHARLQAAAVVADSSPEELLQRALDRETESFTAEQRELLDRIAASLISRSEMQ